MVVTYCVVTRSTIGWHVPWPSHQQYSTWHSWNSWQMPISWPTPHFQHGQDLTPPRTHELNDPWQLQYEPYIYISMWSICHKTLNPNIIFNNNSGWILTDTYPIYMRLHDIQRYSMILQNIATVNGNIIDAQGEHSPPTRSPRESFSKVRIPWL